eukprot:gnl/TRDRNA2_/TRDRNA2_85394_c0_seq1.p1 gnl/TRDRNA2_/TRDRNA2_85394_c0~~gnl/TRDRNA2_/TRDRNA2_85394_c0_seq1.p1  ORF type:complete len:159 (-),score=31.93 gnl/TRDRNA2_/TRDRNA2_85394_c0_seq1:52-528(-)
MDADGIVRGDITREGVRGGTFVLTPDLSGREFVAEEGAMSPTNNAALAQKFLKPGASYSGEFDLGPQVGKASVLLNMVTANIGRWRDENDHIPDTQKVTVTYKFDAITLADENTELNGKMDADGTIRGEIVREGVRGTFMLSPDTTGREFTGPEGVVV